MRVPELLPAAALLMFAPALAAQIPECGLEYQNMILAGDLYWDSVDHLGDVFNDDTATPLDIGIAVYMVDTSDNLYAYSTQHYWNRGRQRIYA